MEKSEKTILKILAVIVLFFFIGQVIASLMATGTPSTPGTMNMSPMNIATNDLSTIDDFNDGVINPAIWNVVLQHPTESGGFLTIDAYNEGVGSYIKNYYGIDKSYEARIMVDALGIGDLLAFALADVAIQKLIGFGITQFGNLQVVLLITGNNQPVPIVIDLNVWHIYRFEIGVSTVSFYIDDVLVGTQPNTVVPELYGLGFANSLQTPNPVGVSSMRVDYVAEVTADAPTPCELLEELRGEVAASDDEAWRKPATNRRNAMLNKLDEAIDLCQNEDYNEAYDKVLNDIQPKLTAGGKKQSWVTTGDFESLVSEILSALAEN